MDTNNFILTLTGPSQSGKSLVMEKIEQLGKELSIHEIHFIPKKIQKYTTRYLRLEEMNLLEKGEETDVINVKEIPDTCDLVYQTYGVRYGLETNSLSSELQKGHSPVVVINDIRGVEEIKKYFSGKVLSLFLFRKIPELEDFKQEAQNRGNVSESEVIARYDKAIAIYRTYIENIVLFDKVILNSVEYLKGEEKTGNTIIDMQLKNVILPILKGEKGLRVNMTFPKLSRIFVIAGNAASGKDEIIRSLLSMGKLQVQVLPKYASRPQEPNDGREMICQYIPKKSYLEKLRKDYEAEVDNINGNLNKIDNNFKSKYQKEFISFRQKLEEQTENEYVRFWKIIRPPITQATLEKYFEKNPRYIDLLKIKNESQKIYADHGVELYEKNHRRYIIYGNDNRLYGCDITTIKENWERKDKFHQVIVASQIGLVNILKKEFEEKRVRLIYAHSEISVKEFEENASDTMKKEKKDEFRKILDDYTRGISDYDHVTIYAKSQLTYEQTSKEEELLDQMFRLLRAY